jgi:hypothetical protein
MLGALRELYIARRPTSVELFPLRNTIGHVRRRSSHGSPGAIACRGSRVFSKQSATPNDAAVLLTKAGLAFVIQYARLLAERRFFLAHANHPQNLYYKAAS